jgi:hypothetical protein
MIASWSNRKRPPKEWAKLLGLPPEELEPDPGPVGGNEGGDPAGFSGLDDPPMMPPGGSPEEGGAARPLSSGELAGARKRIAQAYNALGAGASMATRNDGYAAVTGLYANDLADAWAEAARENQHVAAIMEWVNSGGALGNLVFAHVILLGGFAYVTGYFHQLGPFFGGKLDRFHSAAYRRREEEAAAADGATNGAAGVVGEGGGPAPFGMDDRAG